MADFEMVQDEVEKRQVLARVEAQLPVEQILFSQRIGDLFGRRRLIDVIRKVGDVTEIAELMRIKNSSEYKGLRFVSQDGGLVTVTTWAEFCVHVVGRSREQVDEDIRNLSKLGGQALEALQKIGAGYRDLRALRNLPEGEISAVLAATATGDIEDLRLALEEATERHLSEKAKLSEELTEAREKVAKRDETIAETSKHISELRDSVSNARRAWVQMTPDTQREKLKIEITKAVTAVEHPISEHNENGGLHGALRALHDHLVEHGGNEAHWVIAQLNELQRQIEMLKLRWSAAV